MPTFYDLTVSIVRNGNKRRYPKCAGCRYLSQFWTCDYLWHTRSSRIKQGVHTEPQGGCSLYRSSKTHQEQLLTKKARQKASQAVRERKRKLPQTFDRELAATLYDKGANDLQIGLACNVCKKTVANWRKSTGRPSHQPRGKNYTEKEKTL